MRIRYRKDLDDTVGPQPYPRHFAVWIPARTALLEALAAGEVNLPSIFSSLIRPFLLRPFLLRAGFVLHHPSNRNDDIALVVARTQTQ